MFHDSPNAFCKCGPQHAITSKAASPVEWESARDRERQIRIKFLHSFSDFRGRVMFLSLLLNRLAFAMLKRCPTRYSTNPPALTAPWHGLSPSSRLKETFLRASEKNSQKLDTELLGEPKDVHDLFSSNSSRGPLGPIFSSARSCRSDLLTADYHPTSCRLIV